MRIVAGAHRGRALVAPKGQSTRPTADRARQAMFDVLEHAPWSPRSARRAGARSLRRLRRAGTGGAVSRGAANCVFVDRDPAALEAIRLNLEALRVEPAQAQVVRGEAATARLVGPFDLAFLDPPYAKGLVGPALARLGSLIAPEAVAVLERGAAEPARIAAGLRTPGRTPLGRGPGEFLGGLT